MMNSNENFLSQSLENISQRLLAIENNQSKLADNQAIICRLLETLEQNIKAEMLATNKLMRECKVTLQKIEQSIGKMTGEIRDALLDEVASNFPLASMVSLMDIEDKMKRFPEYAQTMTTYFYKLKGASEDVSTVFRYIFTDEMLLDFNWDGRWDKRSLSKLKLVDISLRVFKTQATYDFEKSVKKSIELSHHRLKQRKYQKNKDNKRKAENQNH